MPILNLAIGKSKYTINCDAGEEEKIISLSERLNERVNQMSLSIRTSDEKTILMLCALMIEDELESAQTSGGIFAKKNSGQNLLINQQDLQYQISQEELENSVAMQIETTADYICKLTKKIEDIC